MEAIVIEAIGRRSNIQEVTATTVEGQKSKGGDHRGSGSPLETGIVESHPTELWEDRAASTRILTSFCLGILPVKVTSSAI